MPCRALNYPDRLEGTNIWCESDLDVSMMHSSIASAE